MRSRVRVEIAASWLALLLALAACTSPDSVPPPVETVQPPVVELPPEIKVGLLLPLTGPASELAEDMRDAAFMALFDAGANDLVLLPRDTQGTAQGARQAATQVIGEGAELILGPLFNQAVTAVSPIAREADIRVLAFSNVTSAASEGTFLLGFRPEEQVARVVRYALEHVARRPPENVVEQLLQAEEPGEAGVDAPAADEPAAVPSELPPATPGPVRIAALAPDDAYGATAMDALRRAVIEGGGDLVATAFYPPEGDPSAVVRQVTAYDARKAALERAKARLAARGDEAAQRALARLAILDTLGPPPFDAILLADGGNRLRSVASLLTFYDVEPATTRFLGTMRWQDDPRVLEEAALQGGWFPAPPPTTVRAFQSRFEAIYGRPPELLAVLAYDATAVAVATAGALGDRSFDSATLANPRPFAGASGLFRLRADELADHALAILEVARGTTRVIDPAPESFVDELAAAQPVPAD
jgi:branched-chain amino acid transport system substrate-binding protein